MTKPGIYRHYKGNLYAVIDTIKESTNSRLTESVVLYYSLRHKMLHVREESEFNGLVGNIRRFEPVD